MSLGAWFQQSHLHCTPFLVLLCGFLSPSLLARNDGTPQNVPSAGLSGLSDRIDAILEEDPQWMMGEKLPEGLLLRRLSLDLRNVVPTQEEVDAFLVDNADNRWSRWIERFQKDPLASERLVDWYDKTLMQRRPFQHTDRGAWLQMLRKAVDDRTSLDTMMRSIVTSAWWNRSQRSEQRFFLDRGGDPHSIARDVGRVLFGRDMQCAQCHDHPQGRAGPGCGLHGRAQAFRGDAAFCPRACGSGRACRLMEVFSRRRCCCCCCCCGLRCFFGDRVLSLRLLRLSSCSMPNLR
jgi:hypothetical protein